MSSFDMVFSAPQRQSPVALIFLAYNYFKIVVRTLWPMVIPLLVGKDSYKALFLYGIILVSIFLVIYTLIDYLRFYFHVVNDELIIEKGVFRRSKTNIPFSRIQSINLEQSLLHQLLNASKVEIDTAGSKEIEFSFAAFNIKKAEILRNLIIDKKSMSEKIYNPEQAQEEVKDKLIMDLSISDLIRLGITQNHVKSFFIILAFMMSAYAYIDDLGIDTTEISEEIGKGVIWKIALPVFFVFALIISFFYSLLRTVILYFQFSLYRTSDGYRIISGLFTKKQVIARDKKIQIIEWSDNPLTRILGIFNVFLKQASSVEIADKNSIIIPGCSSYLFEKIKKYYFKPDDWDHLKEFRISKKIVTYRTIWFGILPAFIGLCVIIAFSYYSLLVLCLIWPFAVYYASLISFRKRNFAINDQILVIRHGLFGNFNEVLKLTKIQSISFRQSIFQRRNRLADLIIYTASGKLVIPFTELSITQNIVNFFLYKVESDHQTWM